MAKKTKNIAVIGLDAFGAATARELTSIGDRVIGVDRDKERVKALTGALDTVVETDPSDCEALREIGLDTVDAALIAINDDLETSVLATINLLEFDRPVVWAKAETDMHSLILTRLGVDRIVSPERNYGERIAQLIHTDRLEDFLKLGEDHIVAKAPVPDDAIGRSPTDITRKNAGTVKLLGIYRNGEMICEATDEDSLAQGDVLLLHGERNAIRRLIEDL